MKDSQFISRQFEDYEITEDKRYLLYYFHGDLQQAFLRYALLSGENRRFREHTGYACSDILILRLQRRLEKLEALKAQCRTILCEEVMEIGLLIETGKLVLKELPIYEERVKCLKEQRGI